LILFYLHGVIYGDGGFPGKIIIHRVHSTKE